MKLWVIKVTDQYNESWIQRVYTSLDLAKTYLRNQIIFWVRDEELVEALESIDNMKENDVCWNSKTFYVNLEHRGMELELYRIEADEDVTELI